MTFSDKICHVDNMMKTLFCKSLKNKGKNSAPLQLIQLKKRKNVN